MDSAMDCGYCWHHPEGRCAYHRLADTDDQLKRTSRLPVPVEEPKPVSWLTGLYVLFLLLIRVG